MLVESFAASCKNPIFKGEGVRSAKLLFLSFLSALIGGLTVAAIITDAGSNAVTSIKRALRHPIQECVDYANSRITYPEFHIKGEGELIEVMKVGDGFRIISISLPNEDFGYFVRCRVSEGSGLINWATFNYASRVRPPF